MADLNWITEPDNGHTMHSLKVGRFEIVIHEMSQDTFDWFVNNLDSEGDIYWQALLEGTTKTLYTAKKDALACMKALARDFQGYSKEMT